MTTESRFVRSLAGALAALLLASGCVERKNPSSGDPTADAVDDCESACERYVACAGVSEDVDSCKTDCSELGVASADAGCTTEFGVWMSCLAGVDVCNQDAPCIDEDLAFDDCMIARPADSGGTPPPNPGTNPGADPCLAYCEEAVAGGCLATTTGGCASECAILESDAASYGPECPVASDAALSCLTASPASVCALDAADIERCQTELDTYTSNCPQ